MQISSSSFGNNEKIPSVYTCDGENYNPALSFQGVPNGARSLVLIMHDPDATSSGGFTHWVVYNMQSDTKEIKENSTPRGLIGMNDADQMNYLGPCPPAGVHHYHFKLYALDQLLDFPKCESKSAVEHAMEGHVIDQAELVGLYTRV